MRGLRNRLEKLEEGTRYKVGDWGPCVNGVYQGIRRKPEPGVDDTFNIVDVKRKAENERS